MISIHAPFRRMQQTLSESMNPLRKRPDDEVKEQVVWVDSLVGTNKTFEIKNDCLQT